MNDDWWLSETRRAERLEAIASAAGDPVLASDATQMARSVRARIKANLRGGPRPYLPSWLNEGDL
jgi:hypothetical protein